MTGFMKNVFDHTRDKDKKRNKFCPFFGIQINYKP